MVICLSVEIIHLTSFGAVVMTTTFIPFPFFLKKFIFLVLEVNRQSNSINQRFIKRKKKDKIELSFFYYWRVYALIRLSLAVGLLLTWCPQQAV